MSAEVQKQFYFLFLSFVWGIGMGWCYDQLVLLRYLIPHSRRILSLEDFFYWISMAAQFFYLLFTYHRGEIRSYILTGLILGYFTYSKGLGPVYQILMKKILYPVRWVFMKIFRVLAKKLAKLTDKH